MLPVVRKGVAVRKWFNGASFYRWGMLVGTIGVAAFLGIGVYYVVDYFTQFILPYPYNLVSSGFVALFIEYKAVSLFLNGFQAIETIKETHNRKKEHYERTKRLKYSEWSGVWAVWAQFIVVIIMDTAGNAFRIYTANQDAGRSVGAFVIYECLVFLPFLAGYSIHKQTTKPVEMIEEDYERAYAIEEIDASYKMKTQELKNRQKQLPEPSDVDADFEDFEEAEEEETPKDFTKARRVK